MEKRYGVTATNSKGFKEDKTLCYEEIARKAGKSVEFLQCPNERGYGEGRLYCKKHAKQHPALGETNGK